MAEIRVKPSELIKTASDLRTHAKILQAAIEAIDNEIRSLGSDKFLGKRANIAQTHFESFREKIFQIKPLIDRFAKDLDEAATYITDVDKT